MQDRAEHDSDVRYAIPSSVVATAMSGEVVILDAEGDRYFSLAGVGALVWGLLEEGPQRRSALVARVVEAYDVDALTCERDLSALLDDLLERGLVVADAPAR